MDVLAERVIKHLKKKLAPNKLVAFAWWLEVLEDDIGYVVEGIMTFYTTEHIGYGDLLSTLSVQELFEGLALKVTTSRGEEDPLGWSLCEYLDNQGYERTNLGISFTASSYPTIKKELERIRVLHALNNQREQIYHGHIKLPLDKNLYFS